MGAIGSLPPNWAEAIGPSASVSGLARVVDFLSAELDAGRTFVPGDDLVFAALRATPLDAVRAVILGQDPYPTRAHATGLAFSVPRDFPYSLPRSLRNIRAELGSDLTLTLPDHGSLEAWTRQGVLLLNTSLTVQEGKPGSHARARWWLVTNAIISAVAAKESAVAFLLWGRKAQSKARLIDSRRHVVIRAAHPSPRSKNGFLGTGPFSQANDGLAQRSALPIDWSLAD